MGCLMDDEARTSAIGYGGHDDEITAAVLVIEFPDACVDRHWISDECDSFTRERACGCSNRCEPFSIQVDCCGLMKPSLSSGCYDVAIVGVN